MSEGLNVLGGALEPCGYDPLTGFWRDGSCRTGGQDVGVHAVCAVMTDEFLEYSRSVGNDGLGIVASGRLFFGDHAAYHRYRRPRAALTPPVSGHGPGDRGTDTRLDRRLSGDSPAL